MSKPNKNICQKWNFLSDGKDRFGELKEDNIVICEFYGSANSNGSTRRVEHLSRWSKTSRNSAEIVAINHHPTNRFSRFLNACCLFWQINRDVKFQNIRILIINGLAAPHLYFLSIFLNKKLNVVFDVCDSLIGQAVDQLKQRRPFRSLLLVLTGFMIRLNRKSVTYTYITNSDLARDKYFLKGKRTLAIYPYIPFEMPSEIALKGILVERFILFYSPEASHTQKYTKVIFEEVPNLKKVRPDLEVHLFSPKDFTEGIPDNVVLHTGWTGFDEIYSGENLLIITNQTNTGVSNKLLEAVYLQKPMILHSSLAVQLKSHPWVLTYRSKAQLRAVLKEAATKNWFYDRNNPIKFCDPMLQGVLSAKLHE